jgi:hypothetical protein
VIGWAKRWSLVNPVDPPAWILSLVVESFSQWSQFRWKTWGFPRGDVHGSLTDERERVLGRYRFNPEMEWVDTAKRRIPLRYHEGVDRIVRLAVSRGGIRSPWKWEPDHFDWLVWKQLRIPPPRSVNEETLRTALRSLSSHLGLSRPVGRPLKPTGRKPT